ncbi:hypothetical protein [Amycolatopsis sp. NPDC049159]|uniref:hypothetical protein n=1 Tax=Amycolatopsis sp. NPDC049159 TaxID=3157210 RepID=UPI0033DB8B45
MTTTDKPAPKLSRRWLITLIVAGALALAGAIVVVVNVTASPQLKQFKVSVYGNTSATWTTDASSKQGIFNLTSGFDTQTVSAYEFVFVHVMSTSTLDATCRIEGPDGQVYSSEAKAGTTVTGATETLCSTK